MNIVLIGYRCSGKTSVGKLIAHKLGRGFVDTDDLIMEKAGCSINEMVKEKGWPYFRDMEKAVIKEVSEQDNLVIATGGGAVIKDINMENLKANGFIIWLDANIDSVKRRLKGDNRSTENRPSLTGNNPVDETAEVMEKRGPLYSKACNMKVDTSKMNINDVADMVIERVETGDRIQKSEVRSQESEVGRE
ncbi:MAG: shikimate kinase [Deltaproteobacteria bacterium]|nr:shikimate kinase [Deltaproteobacteria bacterium]